MKDQDPTEVTPPPQPEPEPEPEPEPVPEPEPEPVPEPAEATTVVDAPPVPAPSRRLERSREDRVLAGVCGGLGEYFGVDAVLIRIAALVLVFAGGAGILLYIVGWIAMPEALEPGTPEAERAALPAQPGGRSGGAFALGLTFVVLGAIFLADEVWSDFLAWKYVWPVALIVVGAAILLRAKQ